MSDRKFVIHKHDSSNLHYDFRLELDGVFKTWIIPTGPSTDPREKRMAIPYEDHSMEVFEWEGYIQGGDEGDGPKIIWDRGTYRNTTTREGNPQTVEEGIESGKITIELKGEKIRGGYALFRADLEEEEGWLFVKMDDEYADARRNPVSTEPESVLTGRTLDEVGQDDHEA
jgi:DNA ligase D-like protein (predicted 3'-phosphoesterase)